MKRYAIYIRVSTQKQGSSGLGLESQLKMCKEFIASNNGEYADIFKDVESGTHRDRKGLTEAITYCKKNGCALVIAKLDRLARDVEFCFKVINTGIEIHFVDMPTINTLLLGVFAAVAQYERELTSDRTKKALAAKKERGEATGGATEKWRTALNNKEKKQLELEYMKRGTTKNRRFLESKDTQAFIKVIRNVFPEAATDDDLMNWDWKAINTKVDNRLKVLGLMRDYKDLDPMLWAKWNLTDINDNKHHARLASYINSLHRSVKINKRNAETN